MVSNTLLFPLYAKAIDLSNDFKPNLPAERQRIETAGHEVTFSERGNVHRIDDGIAISRSLGTVLPDFLVHCGILQLIVLSVFYFFAKKKVFYFLALQVTCCTRITIM
jgi:hypothetical protein